MSKLSNRDRTTSVIEPNSRVETLTKRTHYGRRKGRHYENERYELLSLGIASRSGVTSTGTVEIHISDVVTPLRSHESYDEMTKGKSMARAAIICSIEAEYVPMISCEQDTNKMWQMLDDAHKSKCTVSVHTLRNRIFNIQMGEGSMVRAYVNEICTIEHQLAFVGKVVDDDNVVINYGTKIRGGQSNQGHGTTRSEVVESKDGSNTNVWSQRIQHGRNEEVSG